MTTHRLTSAQWDVWALEYGLARKAVVIQPGEVPVPSTVECAIGFRWESNDELWERLWVAIAERIKASLGKVYEAKRV